MSQFLAIDADARGLFVAAGTVRNGMATVERTAFAPDTPPLSPTTAAELGATLRDLLKNAGIRTAPVLLCIARDRIILKDVRHPPAPPTEEPAIVRFQAVKDLAESPDDVVMDYTPLPSPSADEKRASAVFVRKEVVTAARALCEAAGLKLHAITPRPFTVPELLRRDEAGPAATGFLNVWPGGGEFTVVRGRDVLFARAISPAAAANEHTVAADLRRNLTVYAGQFPADDLAAVYVAEADNEREGWAGRLGEVFSLPFHKLDPLADSTTGETVPDAARGRFAGPVGLLLAKAAGEALPINFASPRQPRPDVNPHRTRILVGSALGALVLAVLGIGGFLEVERAGQRAAAAMSEKASLDSQLQTLELDSKRLAAADEFTGREVVWLDELYDLSDRIPDVAQVRLTEINGSAVAPPVKPTNRGVVGTPATTPTPAPKGPTKPVPVGHLQLVVATENPALVGTITDSLNRDGFYAGTRTTTMGLAGNGSKSQQFKVETDVIHRAPGDYRRKLAVSAPKPPPVAPPGTRPAGGNADFGGEAFP